jgi:hypothetical protein
MNSSEGSSGSSCGRAMPRSLSTHALGKVCRATKSLNEHFLTNYEYVTQKISVQEEKTSSTNG